MDKSFKESLDPLLSEHDEREDTGKPKNLSGFLQVTGKRTYGNILLIGISISLLYIAVGLTYVIINLSQCKESQKETSQFNLLRDALQFEERKEWYPSQYPWNQPPSSDLDSAWDDLLYAQNIRISNDEMSNLNLNTTNRVQVNRGDYFAGLGVFHYLHCLNNLRKVVHWDYYETKTATSEAFGKEHSDHCINLLRQAVMCHPNLQVNTAEWVDEDNSLGGKELRLDSTTTCVVWDSVERWVRPRALRPRQFSFRPGPFYRGGTEGK